LCVLGTFLFAQSQSLALAQLGRFMIGAGSACAFISCLKITADWFSPAKFALVASLTNMMGTLGGTLASSPLAMLVNGMGWRKANIVMAVFGIGVMVLAWLTIRDNKDEIKRNQQRKVLDDLKVLIGNKQIILSGIIGGLMYLPISAFSELWSVPFLMATYGISNEVAGHANVMVFVGMALGGPLAVSLADRIKSYTKVMTISTISTAILFVIIASAQFLPFYSIFIFMFLAGFCIGGQVLCFTCSLNNSEHDLSGSVVALTNALVMASGIVFQPLLGFILDFFWDGRLTAEGVRYYTQDCYQYSILALPISLFVSWYLLKFVRETYNQVHS
jgi:MFS family permease